VKVRGAMNHFFRILLVVGLSSAVVMLILVTTGHFGPEFQTDHFILQTVQAAVGRDVVVEQYVEARLPRRFQRDMSIAWLHRSNPYSLTLSGELGGPVSTTNQLFSDLALTYTVENYASSAAPLPFPPEDVWCVRLKSADPTIPKVVLLALHQDMYTARWVVHEPSDMEAMLSAVGCQFPTQ
jgi:hypothetical protein